MESTERDSKVRGHCIFFYLTFFYLTSSGAKTVPQYQNVLVYKVTLDILKRTYWNVLTLQWTYKKLKYNFFKCLHHLALIFALWHARRKVGQIKMYLKKKENAPLTTAEFSSTSAMLGKFRNCGSIFGISLTVMNANADEDWTLFTSSFSGPPPSCRNQGTLRKLYSKWLVCRFLDVFWLFFK